MTDVCGARRDRTAGGDDVGTDARGFRAGGSPAAMDQGAGAHVASVRTDLPGQRVTFDPARSPAQVEYLDSLFTIRSERQFGEQLRSNPLFKWFSTSRTNPSAHDVHEEPRAGAAQVLLKEVVKEARRWRLLSQDHFTLDDTPLDAWSSHRATDDATKSRRTMVGAAGATGRANSKVSADAAKRMSRRPIQRPSCIARLHIRRRGSATWAMC